MAIRDLRFGLARLRHVLAENPRRGKLLLELLNMSVAFKDDAGFVDAVAMAIRRYAGEVSKDRANDRTKH